MTALQEHLPLVGQVESAQQNVFGKSDGLHACVLGVVSTLQLQIPTPSL